MTGFCRVFCEWGLVITLLLAYLLEFFQSRLLSAGEMTEMPCWVLIRFNTDEVTIGHCRGFQGGNWESRGGCKRLRGVIAIRLAGDLVLVLVRITQNIYMR